MGIAADRKGDEISNGERVVFRLTLEAARLLTRRLEILTEPPKPKRDSFGKAFDKLVDAITDRNRYRR